MTNVLYYEMRQRYLNCVEQLRYLRSVTKEPGWDMGEAQSISEYAFDNAIILVGKLNYDRIPEIQVSTKGNLGLFFTSETFRGVTSKVLSVGVIFRGDEIRVGTLLKDNSESSTGFRWCGLDEINKTAEYIKGIGNNGQDRL